MLLPLRKVPPEAQTAAKTPQMSRLAPVRVVPGRPWGALQTPQDAPNTPQDAPRGPQDAPKAPPRRPQDGKKNHRTKKFFFLVGVGRLEGVGARRPAQKAPGGSQEGPRRPSGGHQEAPRKPQEAPRRPQEAPRGPKKLPGGPRGPQEATQVGGQRPPTKDFSFCQCS